MSKSKRNGNLYFTQNTAEVTLATLQDAGVRLKGRHYREAQAAKGRGETLRAYIISTDNTFYRVPQNVPFPEQIWEKRDADPAAGHAVTFFEKRWREKMYAEGITFLEL